MQQTHHLTITVDVPISINVILYEESRNRDPQDDYIENLEIDSMEFDGIILNNNLFNSIEKSLNKNDLIEMALEELSFKYP